MVKIYVRFFYDECFFVFELYVIVYYFILDNLEVVVL